MPAAADCTSRQMLLMTRVLLQPERLEPFRGAAMTLVDS
jgi:hypothetical protein